MKDDNRNKVSMELKQIIEKEYPYVDISKINEGTRFDYELGIDSLELMTLMTRVEEIFHIEFDNFPYVQTFGDLLTVIVDSENKIIQKESDTEDE